jgi:Pyruvate/2-oxoacid:ferredoxin oxidoreductase delta subunit
MNANEQVYRKLQKHLNNQAVGFPATRSGVELKILRHIFNPYEAEIASFLSYKYEPVETIFEKVKHLNVSIEGLQKILDSILKKGGIEVKSKDGVRHYCCIPLVVGMYELQNARLTPEFIKDYQKYISTKSFGVEFLSTKLPQMRTIPVAKSIQLNHNISSFDEVSTLLKEAEGPFAIVDCICRKKRAMGGKSCEVTDRKETCLGVGHLAQISIENEIGREINREEAIAIIEQNQKEGLILQPSNTKKAEFICSCCGCCCGILHTHKNLPKPVNFWATNYFAVVDVNACVGCGNCEDKCQVAAVKVNEKEQIAYVNLDRCLGCGVCVVNCPNDSISLSKRASEKVPPQNREELHDIIMENKKGKFGKLLMAGNLLVDILRTR